MIRRLLPILASLIVLPWALLQLFLSALVDPDHHRRADAALVLIALLLFVGWAVGVFAE